MITLADYFAAHARRQYVCPHCARLRTESRCWKLAAIFFAVLLVVLLTLTK